MTDDRQEKARAIVEQLWGKGAASGNDGNDDPFRGVALEHLFGEIWPRPGLAIRDRSLITVAALLVLGREKQFALHLRGALNVGVTPEEIEEMMVHLAYYGGFPVSASARDIAHTILPNAGDKN
ncbi:carboxymuconolactone decarboxylase family protein [uncultured Erythrobacter sp.]|uniref:carboxymuconolactone decarboxylase family protein n=1 Tax=Qipengyuania sp. DGS5-3 TaxID=3349632 RepID=UPI002627107D|nr:carboxymuconolactone decarboxylase family protein [uncultured Erythrobacter sp.]